MDVHNNDGETINGSGVNEVDDILAMVRRQRGDT